MRVSGFVVVDSAHSDFDGAVGDGVDKTLVVADEHHRFGTLFDKILQPLYRFDVQVVCGLVEEQHVGIFEQQFGKFDTHTPSARELRCLTLKISAFKAQSHKCLFDVLVEIGVVDGVEFFAQCANLLNQSHIVV